MEYSPNFGEWRQSGFYNGHSQFMRRSRKHKGASFTTLRGILLSISIGAFFVLIFFFVYYMYVLPMQKSLE